MGKKTKKKQKKNELEHQHLRKQQLHHKLLRGVPKSFLGSPGESEERKEKKRKEKKRKEKKRKEK